MCIQHGGQNPRLEFRISGLRGEKIAADQDALGGLLLVLLDGFRIKIPAMDDVNRKSSQTERLAARLK